ncbi:hypothetical protein MKL09_31520 [Methylobacterium sp. J-048]|uniref:hypothetical protein n=1 Tax=Methylobacterium sp. J-048 TaxID=2836635 RepID=UPI001FB8BFC0|nr:hypothetical protein [Methylobacterium sp. J-048]MCJ2061035.1 hypothetical protein [Methylobacterium sp. J-048]
MSFGLAPRQHLEILIEERNLYRQNIDSIRLEVNCCVWTNHLSEIVFSTYDGTVPSKVYSQPDHTSYRSQVTAMHPDLGIIRDLCDFAKHGPSLGRATVKAKKTVVQTTLEVSALFAIGIPQHDEVTRLVVDRPPRGGPRVKLVHGGPLRHG